MGGNNTAISDATKWLALSKVKIYCTYGNIDDESKPSISTHTTMVPFTTEAGVRVAACGIPLLMSVRAPQNINLKGPFCTNADLQRAKCDYESHLTFHHSIL